MLKTTTDIPIGTILEIDSYWDAGDACLVLVLDTAYKNRNNGSNYIHPNDTIEVLDITTSTYRYHSLDSFKAWFNRDELRIVYKPE